MTGIKIIASSLLLLGAAACAGPSDGQPGNPRGTAAERAVDRAAGTNNSGAYPSQSDGRPGNPSGTAVSRAVDRTVNGTPGSR